RPRRPGLPPHRRAPPPLYWAAGKKDRCYRRKHPPRPSGLAWTQLDGQKAQTVELPDVRPGRGTKHHPPRLAPGRPDVEEGQEAAGPCPAPEAGCPCPGTAEAVHPGL